MGKEEEEEGRGREKIYTARVCIFFLVSMLISST